MARANDHAVALVLLDGPWQTAPMCARLLARGAERDVAERLVQAMVSVYPDRGPSEDRLLLTLGELSTTHAVLERLLDEPAIESWLLEEIDELAGPEVRALVASRDRDAAIEALERQGAQVPRLQTRNVSLPLNPPPLPLVTGPAADWHRQRFATPGDLAEWLDLTPSQLEGFADLRNLPTPTEALRNYRARWVGERLIEAPKRRLKALQRRVLDGVLSEIPTHPAAHGFIPGRSVLTATAPHCARPVVLHLDLRAFFAHVNLRRATALFVAMGQPRPVARLLAGLCTTCTPSEVIRAAPQRVAWAARKRLREHHLPQGAPSSPAIANLIAFGLDRRLAALAESWEVRYTRYADDLLFSGGARLSQHPDGLLAAIRTIVIDEGWALHPNKQRVLRAHRRQNALGLILNAATPAPARAAVDQVRAAAHQGEAAERLAGRTAWTSAGRVGRITRIKSPE